MKLVVTGGRFWNYRDETFEFLDRIHDHFTITLLIHGDAIGADRLCGEWAELRGVSVLAQPADWKRDGEKSGGTIRNQKMIDDNNPDMIAVFPGESGTADMRKRARAANIKELTWTPLPKTVSPTS